MRMTMYVFEGLLGGEIRKLSIFDSTLGYFCIYWDAFLMGEMWQEKTQQIDCFVWVTDAPCLQPYLDEIAEFIEQLPSEGGKYL